VAIVPVQCPYDRQQLRTSRTLARRWVGPRIGPVGHRPDYKQLKRQTEYSVMQFGCQAHFVPALRPIRAPACPCTSADLLLLAPCMGLALRASSACAALFKFVPYEFIAQGITTAMTLLQASCPPPLWGRRRCAPLFKSSPGGFVAPEPRPAAPVLRQRPGHWYIVRASHLLAIGLSPRPQNRRN
jgi:hypothetical protein